MRYHSYLFFDAEPSVKSLGAKAFSEAVKEAAALVKKNRAVRVHPYGTLGFKAGTRFLFHVEAPDPESIQNFADAFLHTALGEHLRIAYSLFGMTRSSPYNPHKPPAQSAPDDPHKYLVVYPFTKTIEWHLLPYEERRALMKAHVDVGRKYSDKISQLLLYSYGLDDHEFVVSYQCDSLEDFQTLVMELRGTEARRYTKSDTPIFLCISRSLEETLDLV